mgnify:CR=1 FL=1
MFVIIPSRISSSRLPRKPLADILGKPMVIRVAEKARQFCSNVCVATDSKEIVDVCTRHGVQSVLTSEHHATGTDRLAEAGELLKLKDDDIIVNLQGDEPLMPVSALAKVASLLEENPNADIATLGHPINSREEFLSPNVVKIVLNHRNEALYFSRAPIPYPRDAFRKAEKSLPSDVVALHHLGLYAYRMRFVRKFPELVIPHIEAWESLEQLRALYYGYRIQVGILNEALPPGVDTPEDLERVCKIFSGKDSV